MNDTPEHIAKKQFDILYAKTAKEQFGMAIEMSEFGHRLAQRRVSKANPGLSPLELKMRVFRAYYADCYTEKEFLVVEEAWKMEKSG